MTHQIEAKNVLYKMKIVEIFWRQDNVLEMWFYKSVECKDPSNRYSKHFWLIEFPDRSKKWASWQFSCF